MHKECENCKLLALSSELMKDQRNTIKEQAETIKRLNKAIASINIKKIEIDLCMN